MLRFESFGSGSSGNLYYLESPEGAVLIDAGVGIRKIKKYFREYGIKICKIKGIIVTHNHMDHVRCLGILNEKDGMPVYLTEKTFEGIKENPAITKKPKKETTTFIEKNKPFTLAGMEICAFNVPHDSKDNVGYHIKYGETSFCLVTDCGHWTEEIDAYVGNSSYLVLESNYDTLLLERGPYPKKLKNRITNGNGHLSNKTASEIIAQHQHHLKKVWLCHLSEKNNTLQHALTSAKENLNDDKKEIVEVLTRTLPSKMFEFE